MEREGGGEEGREGERGRGEEGGKEKEGEGRRPFW